MSEIRRRILTQCLDKSSSQDDENQNMKKGDSDVKNEDLQERTVSDMKNGGHQNRTVSEKIEDANYYKQFYDILDEFESTLSDFGAKFGDLKQKLAAAKRFPRSKLQCSDLQKKPSHSKPDKLSEKQFTNAESLLTELFETTHIKTLHNIFIVGLILILINGTISDSVEADETDRIYLGLETVIVSFSDLPRALLVWAVMKMSTIIVFFGFQFWSAQYKPNNKKTFSSKIHNLKYLIAFVAYLGLFLYFPAKAVTNFNYSMAMNFAILMEQVRMIMKVYAFVRSNVANVKNGKQPPDISKFIYFMFAPTLVYRDNYPRKHSVNWASVFWYAIEVILVIVYIGFLFEKILLPMYRNFGIEPLNIKHLHLRVFKAMLPSTLLFVFGFYLLLHSWMNAWAEALRFGDRIFYSDWWTVSSYHHFYRTWNIVVHDWLHTYIYKEVYNYYKSKPVCFVLTIISSAVVHEYIMAFSLGFFYPVMFIFFGLVSIFFAYASRSFSQKVGNVFFWLTLCIGNGLIVSLYLMEAYARTNCPPFTNGTLDVLVPRTWTTCY